MNCLRPICPRELPARTARAGCSFRCQTPLQTIDRIQQATSSARSRSRNDGIGPARRSAGRPPAAAHRRLPAAPSAWPASTHQTLTFHPLPAAALADVGGHAPRQAAGRRRVKPPGRRCSPFYDLLDTSVALRTVRACTCGSAHVFGASGVPPTARQVLGIVQIAVQPVTHGRCPQTAEPVLAIAGRRRQPAPDGSR